MRIELRNDSVILDGYVNAVERESRLIKDRQGDFYEKVKRGTFRNAIKNANEIRMLLNHEDSRQLATTKDNTLELNEDNIGLRVIAKVTDEEVIKKAKNNELRGWSFGFTVNKDSWEEKDGRKLRTLEDINLDEVSLIDNRHLPAYIATSVETRGDEAVIKEKRVVDDEKIVVSEVETRKVETFEQDLKKYEDILNNL